MPYMLIIKRTDFGIKIISVSAIKQSINGDKFFLNISDKNTIDKHSTIALI